MTSVIVQCFRGYYWTSSNVILCCCVISNYSCGEFFLFINTGEVLDLFSFVSSCLFELRFAVHFSLVSLLSLKCFSFLNDIDILLEVQEEAQIVRYALQDRAKVVYALTELKDSSRLAVCINVFSVHQLLDAMLGSISVGSSWTDSLIILNRIKQDWILAQNCFVFELFRADYASRFVVAPIFVIFQISGKLFWLEQPKISTEVTEINWVALCSRWLLVNHPGNLLRWQKP